MPSTGYPRISASRNLSALMRALGADPHTEQPCVDVDNTALVAVVNDLTFASPARAPVRFWTSIIPSSAAAQFSCVEFTATAGGFWVRELGNVAGAANVNVHVGVPFGAFTVNDAISAFPCELGIPEQCLFSQVAFPNVLSAVVPGGTGPLLFGGVQIGRLAVGATGIFLPGGAPTLRDMWVAPGSTLRVCAGAANTVINCVYQFDFPPDAFGF